MAGLAGAVVIVVALIAMVGWRGTWSLWGVPAMVPPFADLRALTGAAESWTQGLDPMVSNPGDPWGRPLNYPRLWQVVFRTGLGPQHTVPIGCAVAALGLLSIAAFPRRPTRAQALILLAGATSPVVAFAFERGTTDLLMFALVTAAVLLAPQCVWAAAGAVFAAFALKLFPLGAAALLVSPRRGRSRLVIATLVVAALLYLVLIRHDLELIEANTQRATRWSYGASVAPAIAAAWAGERTAEIVRLATWVCCGAVAALAYAAYRSARRQEDDGEVRSAADIVAFRAGAGIYVLTFVLACNWDYRLLFVLLTLPAMTSWWSSPSVALRRGVRAALPAAAWVMWSPAVLERFRHLAHVNAIGVLLSQAAAWFLFASLAVLFAATLGRGRSVGPVRATGC